jgi:hypothetical protein
MKLLLASTCLLHLHAPDGSDVYVERQNIAVVRPVTPTIAKQVAHGSRSIIYSAGGRYGVTETPQQMAQLVKQCDARQPETSSPR